MPTYYWYIGAIFTVIITIGSVKIIAEVEEAKEAIRLRDNTVKECIIEQFHKTPNGYSIEAYCQALHGKPIKLFID